MHALLLCALIAPADEPVLTLPDGPVAKVWAGVGADTVSTSSRDIGASFTMEGGELLPEPGSPEEDAWKAPA